mmetsp:Transcript_4261/g.5354  ORF Transcript_4261/g.5354 Transcript_4261/m.5354 type:complete len:109 (-) Transcript_4261:884-1210(-)
MRNAEMGRNPRTVESKIYKNKLIESNCGKRKIQNSQFSALALVVKEKKENLNLKVPKRLYRLFHFLIRKMLNMCDIITSKQASVFLLFNMRNLSSKMTHFSVGSQIYT